MDERRASLLSGVRGEQRKRERRKAPAPRVSFSFALCFSLREASEPKKNYPEFPSLPPFSPRYELQRTVGKRDFLPAYFCAKVGVSTWCSALVAASIGHSMGIVILVRVGAIARIANPGVII